MAPLVGSQRDSDPTCVAIVVMGVSGTGKSTLGRFLAQELGMPFVEGDDLHPKSNVDKMASGHPLNDADREPWLELIRSTAEHMTLDRIAENYADEQPRATLGVVVGCSALKKYYRDILRGTRKPPSKGQAILQPTEPPEFKPSPLHVYFVFIDGPKELLRQRMENRAGHFMKATMLDSQFRTLESPVGEEGVAVVSIEDTTEEQGRIAMEGLKAMGLDVA